MQAIPLLRLEYLFLWLAAVLHKLNGAFFDPATTDAARIFKSILVPVPRVLQPWLTIGYELAIALTLAARRTRGAGVVLALAFALQTGLIGIIQFAAVSLAMVLLFVSDEVVVALPSPVPAGLRRRLGNLGARAVVVALPLVAFMAAAAAPRRMVPVIWLGWLWFSLGVVAALVIARRRSGPLGAATLGLPLAPAVMLAAVTAAHELGPYVGTKDWPVFSMYSNAAPAECGGHLLFRRPLRGTRAAELVYVHDGETIHVPAGSHATVETLQTRLDAYARMGVGGLFVRTGRAGDVQLLPSASPHGSEPVARFFYDYPAMASELGCYR